MILLKKTIYASKNTYENKKAKILSKGKINAKQQEKKRKENS